MLPIKRLWPGIKQKFRDACFNGIGQASTSMVNFKIADNIAACDQLNTLSARHLCRVSAGEAHIRADALHGKSPDAMYEELSTKEFETCSQSLQSLYKTVFGKTNG